MTIETRNAEKFWIWTELNRSRIRETLKAARRSVPGIHIVNVEPMIEEMTEALHDYDPRLQPLVALAADEVLELTVTANARREAFLSAKTLVAAASENPAWRLYALRRRRPVQHALLDGRELRGVEGVRFGYMRSGEKLGITLIVDDKYEPQIDSLQAAGQHVVMALLGEEDFGYQVSATSVVTSGEWRDGSFDAPNWPIDELADKFDMIFSRHWERVA